MSNGPQHQVRPSIHIYRNSHRYPITERILLEQSIQETLKKTWRGLEPSTLAWECSALLIELSGTAAWSVKMALKEKKLIFLAFAFLYPLTPTLINPYSPFPDFFHIMEAPGTRRYSNPEPSSPVRDTKHWTKSLYIQSYQLYSLLICRKLEILCQQWARKSKILKLNFLKKITI